MNGRVLRTVVQGNRRPFEGRPEILTHALDQTAPQAGQIDLDHLIQRYDQVSKPFIARCLPAFETCAAMSTRCSPD